MWRRLRDFWSTILGGLAMCIALIPIFIALGFPEMTPSWLRGAISLVLKLAVVAVAEIIVLAVCLFAIQVVGSLISGNGPPNLRRSSAIDHDVERDCVQLCWRGYRNPGMDPFRYVDVFWFAGGVLGMVAKATEQTAYVVFRGTSETGNWVMTNAQAHMAKASAVMGRQRDGASDIAGGVHQGFLKAFVDLWMPDASTAESDTPDPCPKPSKRWKTKAWPSDQKIGWTKWLLAPFWALLLYGPFVVVTGLWPDGLSVVTKWPGRLGIVLFVLFVIQAVFASGTFEHFFGREHRLAVGPPLLDIVEPLVAKHVIFTGHSLGGALATLAFADYCDRFRDRSAQLVTFGAPQAGNGAFLRWLKCLRDERPGVRTEFCFIASLGDPVAHLPPSATFLPAASRKVSPLGALLSAVYCIGWLPYAWCYGNELGTEWSRLVSWRHGGGLSPAEHTGYCEAAMRSGGSKHAALPTAPVTRGPSS